MTDYSCTECNTSYEDKQEAIDCCESEKCITEQDKSGQYQG